MRLFTTLDLPDDSEVPVNVLLDKWPVDHAPPRVSASASTYSLACPASTPQRAMDHERGRVTPLDRRIRRS